MLMVLSAGFKSPLQEENKQIAANSINERYLVITGYLANTKIINNMINT